MREFIICVATGTAVVETATRPNPVQNPVRNQVLKSAPMPQMRVGTGGKKGRTKRASRKSRKSRKHRK